MKSAATFLMFEGKAEEAMNFYVSLFENSAITKIERYAAGEQGAEGSVKRASFSLHEHDLMCFDSPAKHDFSFTPSISLFVECESETEVEEAFAKLSADGEILMPPGNYGFSRKFVWVKDRFGISWQLNFQ